MIYLPQTPWAKHRQSTPGAKEEEEVNHLDLDIRQRHQFGGRMGGEKNN